MSQEKKLSQKDKGKLSIALFRDTIDAIEDVVNGWSETDNPAYDLALQLFVKVGIDLCDTGLAVDTLTSSNGVVDALTELGEILSTTFPAKTDATV